MKNTFFLFAFLLLASLLAAQELNPYMNMMHSSRCADGNLKVRWDDITGNFLGTQCFYSTNGGNWQNAAVEQLEGLQLQALVPYNWGNVLRYRLRTELTYMNETLVYMQTPFLNADAFPPGYNAMGLIGTDATGDSITVYDDILDFTDSWCAATPNKLYSALANVAGSFPTMNSLTSYNVYATVIANPETVADTLAYAMLYRGDDGKLHLVEIAADKISADNAHDHLVEFEVEVVKDSWSNPEIKKNAASKKRIQAATVSGALNSLFEPDRWFVPFFNTDSKMPSILYRRGKRVELLVP